MVIFPQIMGILNVTPDSFSDGGSFHSVKDAVDHALKLVSDGADIIDIGGESTRPGSRGAPLKEEFERVIPVLREIKKAERSIRISVDTTKYDVAKAALDCGADMINDVSCMRSDIRLAELADAYDAPLILMHSRKTPDTMQHSPYYANLWKELKDELKNAIETAESKGAKKVIADPGIGFAKNYEHNIEILRNFDKLYELNKPLMLGISRKSFIGTMLGIENPAQRDTATALIHSLMLNFRIDYVRVHNVKNISDLKKAYGDIR